MTAKQCNEKFWTDPTTGDEIPCEYHGLKNKPPPLKEKKRFGPRGVFIFTFFDFQKMLGGFLFLSEISRKVRGGFLFFCKFMNFGLGFTS